MTFQNTFCVKESKALKKESLKFGVHDLNILLSISLNLTRIRVIINNMKSERACQKHSIHVYTIVTFFYPSAQTHETRFAV